MSRKLLLLLLFAGTLIAFSAGLPRHYFSGKPACTEDPAWKNLTAGSAEYENKVWALLKQSKPSDFRYFFKTFETSGADTWLVVNLRSPKHCFDARIRVEHWDKLAGMKKTNGQSYPEELYGLKWKFAEQTGKQQIVYVDMDEIVD